MEIFIFSPCLHRSFRELKVSVELAPVPPQNQITEVSKSYALTVSVSVVSICAIGLCYTASGFTIKTISADLSVFVNKLW